MSNEDLTAKSKAKNNTPLVLSCVLFSLAASAGTASAGGFDRGGVKVDLLFEEKQFILEGGVTLVMPQRQLKNIQRTVSANPFSAPRSSSSLDVGGDYTIPNVGLKFDLTDDFSCLGTYGRPYGGYADYGTNNAYSPSAVEFSLNTNDYGLTCGYKVALGETSLGASQLRFIGGFSYMEVEGFQTRQSFLDFTNLGGVPNPGIPGLPPYLLTNPEGVGKLTLEDEAWGWRAGLAYEIPDIALRAQLIYNSAYDLDNLHGTSDTTDFGGIFSGVTKIRAQSQIPQSLEARFQSGIDETTLLFGSVKWQDWSKLQSIKIDGVINPATGRPSDTSLDLYYRDGWTVTGGVGKKITEDLSTQVALSWDRGTSDGYGYQSDTWAVSGGVSRQLADNSELVFGGLIGLMEGGKSSPVSGGDPSNNISYSFDADMVYALNARLRINF